MTTISGEPPTLQAQPYEPPRILWREPYEPMSFGLSCAKFAGNCVPPGPAKL